MIRTTVRLMGGCTWTDEDLRQAVASETRWKGVTRALNLAPSGYVRLRRRANQLNLDVSHFTGKRRWSDYDLRRAVNESASWSEVLERLDLSDTSETRLYIKGHARRIDLNLARIVRRHPVARPDFEALAVSPSPERLRFAAESIATAWFTLGGYFVALPVEQCQFDLLVTLPGATAQRVQVKSSTSAQAHSTWQVGIGRRPYILDKSAGVAPYEPGAVDLFFIVVGSGDIYLIPSHVVAGMTRINVGAYAAYRVGDVSSLLVACVVDGQVAPS